MRNPELRHVLTSEQDAPGTNDLCNIGRISAGLGAEDLVLHRIADRLGVLEVRDILNELWGIRGPSRQYSSRVTWVETLFCPRP